MRAARCSVLLLACALAACTAAPPVDRSLEERHLYALQQATAVYEGVRVAAQQAYLGGSITEAQYDAVSTAGRATEAALRAATGALANGSPAVEADIAALQAALSHLVAAWGRVKP